MFMLPMIWKKRKKMWDNLITKRNNPNTIT